MRRFGLLIRCIGEAVVAVQGLKCLLGMVPFGEQLYDIASDAYRRFKQRCPAEQGAAQIEAVAAASLDEVKEEARQTLAELRAAPPADTPLLSQPEVGASLVAYLEQVPASIRASLRRPDDPTGRSLPRGFAVRGVLDFLRLLPPRPPRFRPGERVVDNWILKELLGVGGFGEVWAAERESPTRQPAVALKFCLDPDAGRVLKHEAQLMAQVMGQGRRPGVVELRAVYLDSDPPCLAYELVDGGDLCGLMSEWLRLSRPKRAALATRLIHKLARIIGPLHRLNPPIVHRDLKPANVLVVRKEGGRFDLKVTDFGIGGLAAQRSIVEATRGVSRGDLLSRSLRGSHTPLYASPEQVRAEAPDPRDDVHALGVMWFQLLVCDWQRGVGPDYDEELRDLDIPEAAVQAINRCVATRQDRRFDDAQALAEHLAPLLEESEKGPTSPAGSAPPTIQVLRTMQRNVITVPESSAVTCASIKLIPTGGGVQGKLPALNLSMVVDVSVSMYREDGTGMSRLHRVQEALSGVLHALQPQDSLSLIAFGYSAKVVLPPTPLTERARIAAALKQLDRCGVDRNGNNMVAGLTLGLAEVEKRAGPSKLSQLWLLTNGETSDEHLCRELAQTCRRKQIKLKAVGIGLDWQAALIKDLAYLSEGIWLYLDANLPGEAERMLQSEFERPPFIPFGEVEMHLRPMKGVQITRLRRTAATSEELPLHEVEERHLVAFAGTLENEVTTDYLVELIVPRRPDGRCTLASLEVTFDPGGGNRETSGQIPLEVTYSAAGESSVNF